MSLTKSIISVLNGYVYKFSEKISEKHGIPLEELLELWCEEHGVSFAQVFAPMMKISKKQIKMDLKKTDVKISEDLKLVDEEDEIPTEEDADKPASPPKKKEKKPTKEKPEAVPCDYIFNRGPNKGNVCGAKCKTGTKCSKHNKK